MAACGEQAAQDSTQSQPAAEAVEPVEELTEPVETEPVACDRAALIGEWLSPIAAGTETAPPRPAGDEGGIGDETLDEVGGDRGSMDTTWDFDGWDCYGHRGDAAPVRISIKKSWLNARKAWH